MSDISNANIDSVELQAPERSNMPLLCFDQSRNVGRNARRKWTREDDRQLQHLRNIADLPWASIARYFPHCSQAVLRYRFNKSSAIAADRLGDLTQPKRRRGRPRKHERPLDNMERDQERRIGSKCQLNRNRTNLSLSPVATSRNRYVASCFSLSAS